MNLSLPLFDLPAVPGPGPAPARPGAGRAAGTAGRPPPRPPGGQQAQLALPEPGPDPLADARQKPPWARVGVGMGVGDALPGEAGAPGDGAPGDGAPGDGIPVGGTDPVGLHPALWRASQLGGGARRCTPSGFAVLDAQLPGGGWPHGVLTELLLPQPGLGELRLLAPALAAVAQVAEGSRCVMLFDPPAQLSAWALAQQGLATDHWLVVQGRSGTRQPRTPNGLAPMLAGADVLWALEQALRSGQVGAVLAWLPLRLRADALRRLQLAAQAHAGPVFVFRDAQARSHPSAAPLRLLLQPGGIDTLVLRLLKRRGPPLAEPLRLLLPSVLTPRQQAQAVARQALQGASTGRSAGADAAARPSGLALRR